MRRSSLRGWRYLVLAAFALGSMAYAATRPGERMIQPPYLAALIEDLTTAARVIEPHSPVLARIEAGEVDAAREMLSFRPLAEAPIPEGFPTFTPVGVIELKRYPAYRKAVGASFWPLFQHISRQDIPMTAPVEMTSDTGVRGDGEMAFLYQNTTVGEPGPIDGIEVADTGETLVISLGVRGRTGQSQIDEARETLEAWLADQAIFRRVGQGAESFRLFGYNSPMVADSEKYWEAQMLIEPIEPAAP